MKQRVCFINCQKRQLVFTVASCALSFLSQQAFVLFAEVGLAACWTTAGLERRPVPGGQRSAYRFYSATKKVSRHTKLRLCPSARLPLREDVLASRNGRKRTMVIGRWKDVAIVLNSGKKKKGGSCARARVFMNDSCCGGATHKKRRESFSFEGSELFISCLIASPHQNTVWWTREIITCHSCVWGSSARLFCCC